MPNLMAGEQRLEVAKLQEAFPDAIVKVKEFRGDTFICVPPDRLTEQMTFLRDDPELQYDYFVECMGVDYSTWKHERDFPGRFEVVYNLFSVKNNSRIFVKTSVDDGQKVPSMIPIWVGAEYPQREVTDLYGVIFEGNEPKRGERFLLPDDWSGFPLRKEYPLGGEDVLFDKSERGPAVEDISMPHAGESFEGKTGSEDVSGR
jgi:NADH-quinone oxidoreductase subunit C